MVFEKTGKLLTENYASFGKFCRMSMTMREILFIDIKQKKNDSLLHNFHFDICELQDEERDKKLKVCLYLFDIL